MKRAYNIRSVAEQMHGDCAVVARGCEAGTPQAAPATARQQAPAPSWIGFQYQTLRKLCLLDLAKDKSDFNERYDHAT